MSSKPIILTLLPHYVPGYKSGGPIRTIENLVSHLGEELDFRIVTSDRDALGTRPYADVQVDEWNEVGKANVFYAAPTTLSIGNLTRLINETRHDVLYLNSFFSLQFTSQPLLARRLRQLRDCPVIIAPRGEFSSGALTLKKRRKRLYLWLSKAVGLYRDLTWQASSEYEARQIRRVMGSLAERIAVAPDPPPKLPVHSEESGCSRRTNGLRVCFLSRIVPKKNLDFALAVLSKVDAKIEFNMIGPVRDEDYWSECQGLIGKLPENISARYRGPVPHREVEAILKEQDLFFLPTRGENYGHAIAEALAVGTPVLIADTTPWRDLEEAGVGWDLSLDEFGGFVKAVETAAGKDGDQYAAWRQRVKEYARKQLMDPEVVEANRRLFQDPIESASLWSRAE